MPARSEPLPPVTAGTFGDLCGVHHNTVTNWIKAGLPVERDGQRVLVDLAAGFQWVRERDRKEVEAARARADPEGARAAKLNAEARLKELDLEVREGKLVPAAEVEERWTQIAVSFREAMMATPGVLVQDGLVDPADEAQVEDVMRAALLSLTKSVVTDP